MKLFLLLISAAALLRFAQVRLLRYLRSLQQDEYSPSRFLLWFRDSKAFDRRGSLVAFGVVMLLTFVSSTVLEVLINVVGAATLFIIAEREPDPRRIGKITLKMTERATRTYQLGLLLFALLTLVVCITTLSLPETSQLIVLWSLAIVLVQSIPFLLLAAIKLLQPAEKRRQERFEREARQIVRATKPYVIGITGSYGKTSVKNMLGEVLQTTLGSTLWPEKGTNTLMGNVQAVRERLNSSYRFAVIEMGAYRLGSIEHQCNLFRPRAGIITAIGEMHLERFGSKETIYQAKTELARALPENGILVCNADNTGSLQAAKEFRKQTTITYGLGAASRPDCQMLDYTFSAEGTRFTLNWKSREFKGKTRLLGTPALSNILAAFSMACALGSNPELVLAAIANIEPVDNRLSVAKERGVTYLRDAYNSNPIGFSSALEVLSKVPGGRKILITPGMVELGEIQSEENEKVAQAAATACDVVYLVGLTNRESLVRGLKAGGMDRKKMFLFDDRDSALRALASSVQDEDVVLVENDLPDLYEDSARF